MPDYFTHNAMAQVIYRLLPDDYKNKIKSSALYLLGAQGGDLFFTYKLSAGGKNVGRSLHDCDAYDLFLKLCGGNADYVCGFATHYALDCTVHPVVYAFESMHRTPFAHQNFEADLGLYCSRKTKIPRKIMPRSRLLGCTFSVYDTIKRVKPCVTVTGVERCIKRHFTYTEYLFRTKRNGYKYSYDYSSLDGVLENAANLGVAAVRCVLDGKIEENVFGKKFLQKF